MTRRYSRWETRNAVKQSSGHSPNGVLEHVARSYYREVPHAMIASMPYFTILLRVAVAERFGHEFGRGF